METVTNPTLPLPLQRYRLFESHDMDEARESVARVFCPHGLVMLRPRTELDACHHSARLHRDVSLNYVQYGPGVQIDPGYLQEFFLLQIPLRGGAEIRCGAQQVDATPRLASLPSPTEPLSMRWADDSPHLIVQLSRPALLSRLESLLQAPVGQALVFDLGVPLDNPALAPLVHFIDYLRLTLDAGNALQAGSALAEHAEAYLMSSLLMSAGHNHSRALAGDAQRRCCRGWCAGRRNTWRRMRRSRCRWPMCAGKSGAARVRCRWRFASTRGKGRWSFCGRCGSTGCGPSCRHRPVFVGAACARWRRDTAFFTWGTLRRNTVRASGSGRPRRGDCAACDEIAKRAAQRLRIARSTTTLVRLHPTVITTSAYSLGTTSPRPPPMSSSSSNAVMSRCSAACPAASSAPKALCVGP
jgi:hypothetical protein